MTVGKTLVGALAVGAFAASPAFASQDVQGELAEMRELMQGLKEKVEAQEEQLEHQGKLLEESQEVVRRQQEDQESLSSLAEFWNAIDVNMSVAGSYAYNFNNPDLGTPGAQAFPGANANQGSSGLFYPFHGDHNSFQVDQVYFDIGKQATDESRAGFMFTLLYGNTAAFLGQGSPAGARFGGDSTSDYYIHQAYVNYLAPIGEGVDIRFGKFATLIGAEVADTSQNFNITNGNVYNLFQPIDHLGVLASTSIGPISLAAGVVNEGALGNSSPDINKEKSYLGQIGFSTDRVGAGVTVLYGAEGGAFGAAPFLGDNEQKVGTVDFLGTFSSDAFEAWVNADYVWVEGAEASGWGVAIAGRVPITDAFSAALRAEYARDKGNFFGFPGAAAALPPPPALATAFSDNNSEVYGITGTLAYEIAENLTVRGEIRWDRVRENMPFGFEVSEFITDSPSGSEDQVVGLAQVVYAF